MVEPQTSTATCRLDAIQYSNWTCNDWRRIIFSDKSTFYVLKTKNRAFGQRKIVLELTNTGDGGNVGISGFDTTSTTIYIENMDSTMYCKIVKNEVKQSMAIIPDKTSIIVQHDLTRWYTSDMVKDKIAKMKLNILDWPSKCSNLNPIEMLWSTPLDKSLGLFIFLLFLE